MREHNLKSSLSLYWRLLSLIASHNTTVLSRKSVFIMILFHLFVNIVFWTLFFVWWCLCTLNVSFALSAVISVLISFESFWITFTQSCFSSLLLLKRNKLDFLSKSFTYKKFWINCRIMSSKKSCILLKSLLMIIIKQKIKIFSQYCN